MAELGDDDDFQHFLPEDKRKDLGVIPRKIANLLVANLVLLGLGAGVWIGAALCGEAKKFSPVLGCTVVLVLAIGSYIRRLEKREYERLK